MPFTRLRKVAEWPGMLWLAPLILAIGSFVGVALYKAYVTDPLSSVNDKVDALSSHVDKVEANVTETGKEVSAANAKLDVLLNRRTANASYESRQEDGVYKVSR